MNNQEIVTVKSVEVVPGESVKPAFVKTKWRSQMQKIYVNEKTGYFIENIEGNSFSNKSMSWKGIDMKQYIGKKILIEKYDMNFHPSENGIWIKFIREVY